MTDTLLTLSPHHKDLGGGFEVRRVLPAALRRAVGPFVFFDHFGPATEKPGDQHDVRPHPHIGLATVTYLFEGAMMHRDSLGTEQEIRPGAVNWMTAGKGIVHSERKPEALKTDATLVRGCSASVWVYPTRRDDGALHFLADSNAAITKGIIALVLTAVQDRQPAAIAATDIAAELAPFDLKNQLSSNRTQGIPNMIALIRKTAARYAG